MSKSAENLLNAIIVVVIMIGFQFIPPFLDMTPLGMNILGIFIGTFWGWIKCDMVWPSILALTLLGFTGYTDNVVTSFTLMLSNNAWQTCLWLLIFTAILQLSGLSKELANRMVSSRICEGRPWVLSIVLFVAAAIIAAFRAHIAALLLGWGFVYSICEQVGYTRHDKWPIMMIVGIAFAVSTGSSAMPFMTGTVATFGYLTAASGGEFGSFSFIAYLCYTIPVFIISTTIYFLICRFLIRPDMEKLKAHVSIGGKTSFDEKQKIALGALVGIFIFSVGPSLLPDGPIKMLFDTIGLAPIALLITAAVTLFRDKEGKPYYTFQELAQNGLLWGMLFMVGSAVVLGTALSSDVTGFSASVEILLAPLLSQQSPFILALFVIVMTLLATNFINNAVCGALMVPLMYAFALQVGASPQALTAAIAIACNIGLCVPSASAVAALLYSNTKWLTPKIILKYSLLAVGAAALALIACVPLADFLFPL